MDTVAGPGYCLGRSVLDPKSLGIRSLAVSPEGQLVVDAGPPNSGLFGVVPAEGYGVYRARPKTVYSQAQLLQKNRDNLYKPWALRGGSAPGLGLMRLPRMDAKQVATADERAILMPHIYDSGLRRDYSPDANFTPFLGNTDGAPRSLGDGALAAKAGFTAIQALAMDEQLNIYVADQAGTKAKNAQIRFVNNNFIPKAVPSAIILYAGTSQERAVKPGAIDTVAGKGRKPNAGDDGPALQAGIGTTSSMVVAGKRLYIASYIKGGAGRRGDARVRMVNLGSEQLEAHGLVIKPGTIATVAGGHGTGFAGDGGPARRGSFSQITGMAADADGNLYLADRDHHRIRRVDSKGRITTVAGTGGAGPRDGGFNGNNLPAVKAKLNRPFDVKTGPQGRLYITDDMNGQIRYIDSGGIIHAAFGSGIGLTWTCRPQKSLPASGPERGAEAKRDQVRQGPLGSVDLPTRSELPTNFGGPSSLATGGPRGVYVATPELGQVKLIEPSGVVSTVAGDGRDVCPPAKTCPPSGGDGGPALSARLDAPALVAASPRKGFYVFDRKENRIRFVNTSLKPLRINGVKVAPGAIAGIAGAQGDAPGATTAPGAPGAPGAPDPKKAVSAAVPAVSSLAADRAGNLFIAEPDSKRIRRIDSAGAISTFIGEGGDFNVGSSGCCTSPSVVAPGPRGSLYIYDKVALKVFLANRGTSQVTVHGQKVAAGAIAPVAGNGKTGFGGDNGPALTGSFTGPEAMTTDGKGNLYIVDRPEATVRKVDSKGVITTVAGAGGTLSISAALGAGGFNGDGLKGQLTAFSNPSGIALDSCGNLLIADSNNDRVRRLNLRLPCGVSAGQTSGATSSSGLPPALLIGGPAVLVLAGVIYLLVRRTRSSDSE